MSNEQKNSRTVIENLPVGEQELTAKDMEQVQGGTSNLNLSKSNINVAAPTNPPVPPLATATTVKGSKSNTSD